MKDKNLTSHNTSEQGSAKPRASNKKYEITTPKGHKVRLTKSQKAYADLKLTHPNQSLNKIAEQAYPNANEVTARQIVNQNEQNKNISIYSEDQVNQAKTNIVDIANDTEIKAETRLKANQDILDRETGKAIQKIQTSNTSVNLNVEVDNEMSEAFTAFLKGFTKQG